MFKRSLMFACNLTAGDRAAVATPAVISIRQSTRGSPAGHSRTTTAMNNYRALLQRTYPQSRTVFYSLGITVLSSGEQWETHCYDTENALWGELGAN